MSVKGTNVSPCASAGSAHSGRPKALRPAIARLDFKIARRLGRFVIVAPCSGFGSIEPRLWSVFGRMFDLFFDTVASHAASRCAWYRGVPRHRVDPERKEIQ